MTKEEPEKEVEHVESSEESRRKEIERRREIEEERRREMVRIGEIEKREEIKLREKEMEMERIREIDDDIPRIFLRRPLLRMREILEGGKAKENLKESEPQEEVLSDGKEIFKFAPPKVAENVTMLKLKQTPGKKEKLKPLPKIKRRGFFSGFFGERNEPEKKKVVVSKKIVQYLVHGRVRGLGFGVLKRRLMENKFGVEEINRAIVYVRASEAKRALPDVSIMALDSLARVKRDSIYREKNKAIEKVGYPRSEKKFYAHIESIDDLDRVKKKIQERRRVIGGLV